MPYRSVTLVEDSVKAVAGGGNASFTTLLPLPEKTWEGRSTHAVRVGAGTGRKVGVYLTGCLHAREWGSAEILLHLLETLPAAYRNGGALKYGNRTFSAAEVKRVVEGLNLYVYPQANPDGRHYSMTTDAAWRKNRRPHAEPAKAGVDVNRNFDVLWDFPKRFSPNAAVVSSTDPAIETYIGPAAESEPETRNVASLLDAHPDIRFFVDVHSYTEVILYGWGDDDMQSTDAGMTYANPVFDDDRGVKGDVAYREFMPGPDLQLQERLATRMRDGITKAGNAAYVVKPSFDIYAQSGTSTERFFKRYFDDRAKGRVHGFTVEWGQEFQPPWATMATIVGHVCAGIMEFCLGILDSYSDVYVRHHASDTGDAGSADPFWESPDVVVRQLDDGVMENQDLVAGQDNWIYVRFTNRGPRPTRQVKVGLRAAAYAGTEFRYPHDWTANDDAHLAPVPVLDAFDNVPVGATRVAKFRLLKEQSARLGDWQEAGWHPCLLAEADCVTDYGTPGRHSWESNNLAQRNVTVVNAPTRQAVRYAFLAGHTLDAANPTKLRLDATGLMRDAVVTVDALDDRVYFPAVDPALVVQLSQLVPTGGGGLPTLPDLGDVVASFDGVQEQADRTLRMVRNTATLELKRAVGKVHQLVATVQLPPAAPPGRYPLRVAQLDAADRVIGGVTLEVRVPG